MKNKALQHGGHKYFLETYKGMRFQHGGVGNTDIEKVLLQEGYQPVALPEGKRLWVTLKRFRVMNRWLKQIPAGAEIVCQFPVYARMYRFLLKQLCSRNLRVIILIADIDGLKTGNGQLLRQEISELQSGRYFIVHNANMEAWLKREIPDAITSQLGPFDFLTEPVFRKRTKGSEICFAGNLAKSGFIRQLPALAELEFHLYGEGLPRELLLPANCIYHGSFEPSAMPAIIRGNYGLVWDGESVSGAKGPLGEYMHYIFHHKISLYILAGLPIIAPAFAGSAEYIKTRGIGWLVNSLEEIPELIKTITEEEYQQVIERMHPLALEISQGLHLKNALEAIRSVPPILPSANS